MRPTLPVDPFLDEIATRVASERRVVVMAEPGAGKSTRVPPRLSDAGKLLLIQPRRVAARSLARRIAQENDWKLGDQVGWHIRGERRFAASTSLVVMTEGMLLQRLIRDPFLSDVKTVVLDEFHERTLDLDLSIALLRESLEARDDLRVVVMSATLDAKPVLQFLDATRLIEVPGRSYPLQIEYAPQWDVPTAVQQVAPSIEGDLLVFLPGVPEINAASSALRGRVGSAELLALHGSLPAAEQERALRPGTGQRVILSTNVAETSLTVPGVRAVIDAGLQKVPLYDESLGFDRLETIRISQDAADQRAGRAARTAAGQVWRLWDERDERRAHRQPEIERVDLTPALLRLAAWGEPPEKFTWFQRPEAQRVIDAQRLLQQLGALDGDRLSPLGEAMLRLPLPPRLARIVAGASDRALASRAVAALSENWRPREPLAASDSDLLAVADHVRHAPRHVQQLAREIAQRDLPSGDESLVVATYHAYADRLARRREPGSDRYKLRNGHGCRLASESGVREAEWLVGVDLQASRRGARESLLRIASAVPEEAIVPESTRAEQTIDASSGRVRAFEVASVGELEVARKQIAGNAEEASALVCQAMQEQEPSESEQQAWSRLRFAGIALDRATLLERACVGKDRLFTFDPLEFLDWKDREQLDREAPRTLQVPSGRNVAIDYDADGSVHIAVKLQELFGWADSPCIGPQRLPVTVTLLAPNGRPVQKTQDLRSFWERGYPEVRKQLRGRYPKHPWPEDPWTATPTAKTKRRR